MEQYGESESEAKVYALALRFIAVRPRSQQEMVDYLRRKGCEMPRIEVAIIRLKGAGLLNDRQFADNWVASRQSLRPRSKRRLEQELLAKGVARDDIAPVLSALGGEGELSAVMEIIQKKRRLPQYYQPDKLMGYLARQGFAYDVIKKALMRLDE